MATPQEIEHLAALRRRHRSSAVDWALSPSGAAIEAVIVANTSPLKIATLSDNCDLDTRTFLLHAHDDLALVLRLFDRACDVIRKLQSEDKRTKPARGSGFAAECAMRCAEPAFLAFLREAKGIDTTDAERTTASVRNLLGIQSRNELNTDTEAARRWQDLKGEFTLWSRT